jgi:hypothetical protein
LFHDRMFRERIPLARIAWPLLAMLTLAVAGAEGQERLYTIGPTVDVVTGSDSHPLNSLPALPQASTGPSSFFRFYPSISLDTSGGKSTLRASYTLGLTGTQGDVNYATLSHGATLAVSYPAAVRWKINVTESFLTTSDAVSFNGLRSTSPSPDEFRFLFNPASLRVSTRTNTAGIVTEYTLNPRSTLSLAGSDSMLNYGSGSSQSASLSDQQFVAGSINYTQKAGTRDAWGVGYTEGHSSSPNFGTSASRGAHVTYSLGVADDVKLDLTVGASRVESTASAGSPARSGTAGATVGYNASIILSKTKLNDSFSVRFRQDSGQPTGLNSISDNRQIGVSIGRRAGTFSLFLDASVFDSQGILGNTLNMRGGSATASIATPLTETLSIGGGAQYQRYAVPAPLGFTQQLFFVTLRYRDPKLWTIFR